jgi:hypothetical protein
MHFKLSVVVNPGTIRSTYPTLLRYSLCNHLYSSSCIESGDNKFTAEKSFLAEQIAPEIIFFFLRQIACLIY